jgi:hypothetical protein
LLWIPPLLQVIAEAPLFGFEQEYTMLEKGNGRVLGWPEGGYPAPQGPFYCGVGTNSVFGRPLAEAHMEACLEAGLTISGINAEVRPAVKSAHTNMLVSGAARAESCLGVLVVDMRTPQAGCWCCQG